MGVKCSFFILLCVFCVYFLQISSTAAQGGFTVCDIQGCNCTVKAASWKVINCSLHGNKVVNFDISIIPKETFELYIYGGQEINFASKTFSALNALTLIHINGTQKVVMEKKSFYHVNPSSLLIQIQSCDELIIKTGAFEFVESSVSTEITNIAHVTIEQEAFSKLYNSSFKNVRKLKLLERSFDFKHQISIGRHGPVTAIYFDNVAIPEVPKEAFLKSLASVMFYNSHIGDVHTDAFKATEISSVVMMNTTLDYIHEGAFTDRTLISDLKINKCKISKISPKAIMAAIGNFSITYSNIQDIESKAFVTTAAQIEITGNAISNIHSSAFVFNNWNRIVINDNIIKHVHANFVQANTNTEMERFTFKGNELHNIEIGALNFLTRIPDDVLHISDNFFSEHCNCNMKLGLGRVTNGHERTKVLTETSFCILNDFLGKCFSLPEGVINIKNFTERICPNITKCDVQEKIAIIVNTTLKSFTDNSEVDQKNWLIFILSLVGFLLIAIIASFIILLLRGSKTLKDKCFFRNVQYNINELATEEEPTVVTADENEKLQFPEELTLEFLQVLSKRLDDPVTHQEASEMIERLYEMFIVDDSYENNNREEEAHLYEELGNLSLQIPPPPYEEHKDQNSRSILKLMEEKINFNSDEQVPNDIRPTLMIEYSEPNDAAVHLYSEIKNKFGKPSSDNSINLNDSAGSAIEQISERFIPEPGPSRKF